MKTVFSFPFGYLAPADSVGWHCRYLVLDEMLLGVQLAGAVVTLVGIYMVNLKVGSEIQDKVD
jgi:hypothetical protein